MRTIAVTLALLLMLSPVQAGSVQFTPSGHQDRSGDVAMVAISSFLFGLIIYAIVKHHNEKKGHHA